VELGDFQQSGVLESEATVLDFLYRSLPKGTVPTYIGHYRSSKGAALLMEYLPGKDMHYMREEIMATNQDSSRRIAVKDAVYMTADVMLPLLKEMHQVGIVHRDVKPSNCVRRQGKEFCMVDFGLSKSIVVPADAEVADKDHAWPDSRWLKPLNYNGPGCYRKERAKAEFRGTSMYASPRVHQGRDYCPRDDVWSLLYVFCDLVSGGLPWMSHAASRERESCQAFKERIHANDGEESALLLMGDHYHVAAFRREKQLAAKIQSSESRSTISLPEPHPMSKDKHKVNLLRKAFRHLSELQFYDTPDYKLIQECIWGFLELNDVCKEPSIEEMRWESTPETDGVKTRPISYPTWELIVSADDGSAIDETIFQEVEVRDGSAYGVLPLEFQFKIGQMEYNQTHGLEVHQILNDWMQVALPLLYKEWDAKKFEDGGHRTSTDGFRRDRYLSLLQACLDCAKKEGCFQSRECYYYIDGDEDPTSKKRKVEIQVAHDSDRKSPLVFVSRVLIGLERAIELEKAKKSPPPVRISFS
jgi:tau tubulin kinase